MRWVSNYWLAANRRRLFSKLSLCRFLLGAVSGALAFTVKLLFTFLRWGEVGVNNFICVYQVYDVYLYII